MIVRFFDTGTSNGESPVRYLLRTTDHEGNARAKTPEVLEGSPELTISIINSIQRKYKYASGCLAFRPEEQPTRKQLFKILDHFKAVVAPGLDSEQFNSLFVLHREPVDKRTGLSGLHVHFVLPMMLLGGVNGQGKHLAGKRWNPHPPGDQSISVMSLFTQIINHEHNWKHVHEKKTRLGLNSIWLKGSTITQKRRAELLHTEALKVIRSGLVADRRALMTYMEDELGITITRASAKTISVKFPGSPKAIKLSGHVYSYEADYKTLLTASKIEIEGTSITDTKKRLETLLKSKAEHITYTPKTKTRKEHVYERQQRNQPTAAGATAHRRPAQRDAFPSTRARSIADRKYQHVGITSSLERTMLQTSGRQWADSYVRSHQEDGQRSGDAQSQPQQVIHLREEPSATAKRGEQWWGQRSATFNSAAEIDEQIRSLSIQLNDCPLGSLAARAMDEQLTHLKGAREKVAHPHPQSSLRMRKKP